MKFKSLTFDAERPIHGKFIPSKTAERDFLRALKKVAQTSAHIVESHLAGHKIIDPERMQKSLNDYAKLIGPWAERQAAKMLGQVRNSNARAYKGALTGHARIEQEAKRNKKNQLKTSAKIAAELKMQLGETKVGALARQLLNEQVGLIKSIPIEAGLRAQKLAYEAVLAGTRSEANSDTIAEIQKQLGLTLEVATNRAKLIAVTETARANAKINQARATSVGSTKYRWHNSGDGAVRDSHKTYKGRPLQGRIFEWDNPPTLDDGMTGNPGEFPRCRCYSEPLFED